MTRFQAITPISLLLASASCGPPPLCSTEDGCHDIAAEVGEETPPPDLPCGGADLRTDDANCGVCGNACDVVYSPSETPYSSGHCIDGECGPHFVQCGLFGEDITCTATCQALGGQICVERGCPGVQNEGVTALVFHSGPWETCLPAPPDEEFVQGCDVPLPFTLEHDSQASCCCMWAPKP